jgi:hypothetical protein
MVALIVVLSLAVVVLAYALKRARSSHKSAYAYSLDRAQEAQFYRERLKAVLAVVGECAGGVEKRISEHAEIVGAIKSSSPHLLEEVPGLKHWLSANDQFYKALRDASAQPNA